MTDALPLTGERTVPGIATENYWFRRHEAAYLFAAGLLADAARSGPVLEVGCGEGYGTSMLAAVAGPVLGLDYDSPAITHAARTYPSARFVRANLAALPVRAGSCAALVTLQVVEHVWNHPEFVGECARVLRPGATMLMSTPNRLTFSPGLDAPVNPFHTVEFTAAELVDLLEANGFAVQRVLGLHAGSRLRGLDAAHGGSFVDAQLRVAPDEWDERLRLDVAAVGTGDFEVLDAAGADIDASLDLLLVARPV